MSRLLYLKLMCMPIRCCIEDIMGLFAVPLTQIDVNVQILGFVAEVTSSLYYSNYEESPVEAEFTFPVDDASAVFRFEAEIEGRHIVAEIQEKEQVTQV